MKILGVDYGLKRIGIAIGDTEVNMAFARPQMNSNGSPELDAQELAKSATDECCDLIVIGMPFLESGEEGEQARIVRQLENKLIELNQKTELWDERYSSSQANANLMHLPPEKRKEISDSEAARIILTDYMERRKP